MYRGTIEEVRPDVASGWMFCEDVALRDRLVLAFVDGVCVGSGRVEVYRADLEAAGLGDGVLGFTLPLTLSSPADTARVAVKLDRSDAWLLQQNAIITSEVATAQRSLSAHESKELIDSYKWMLSKGWLRQSDYDFLKALAQFGVYERALTGLDGLASSSGSAEKVACDFLALTKQRRVEIVHHEISTATDFSQLLTSAREQGQRTIFALWAPEGKASVNVVEGSHLGRDESADGLAAAVRLQLDPDRLIFLDSHCEATASLSPGGALQIFSERNL